MQRYPGSYHRGLQEGSRQSAAEIVPLLQELIRPQRVIDVGCGLGTWLVVFRENGVEEVWGVDGPWIDRSMLSIPEDRFITWDLNAPLQLDREFDLALCLEVAEHLPSSSAQVLLDSLTCLAPVILFSAAIPFQGGGQSPKRTVARILG